MSNASGIYTDPIQQTNYLVWITDESANQVRVKFKADMPGGFEEELWLPSSYVKKNRAAGEHAADAD